MKLRETHYGRLIGQKRFGNEDTIMFTILVVLLILMLLGAIPTWPHSRSWGYGPTGGIGTVLVILLILYFLRVI